MADCPATVKNSAHTKTVHCKASKRGLCFTNTLQSVGRTALQSRESCLTNLSCLDLQNISDFFNSMADCPVTVKNCANQSYCIARHWKGYSATLTPCSRLAEQLFNQENPVSQISVAFCRSSNISDFYNSMADCSPTVKNCANTELLHCKASKSLLCFTNTLKSVGRTALQPRESCLTNPSCLLPLFKYFRFL